ncbi:lysophospholipid acyltransferase family protein [Ilumatobacter coccineus]|uniref:Putative acyltransferase n=1 Tax=Ilumatobacter coccineus (strain NBRC 103263 / KCTC 29153 / YM16-304) TaxID=1313172 RepID=A0A6C7EAY1_ILUCY|nr:lysophospholipid acyltransferase family protein [Ilumatobacter coccineus]BAN02285.1 putative acyltransferase [Ilumatobacter coccineus YM16-304]
MTTYSGAGAAQRRLRAASRPVVRRLWDIEVIGYDRLPETGGAILCPNHISFLDSAFLMLTAPRNISFLGKAEYLDSWSTRFLFPALGMIPVDRSGGRQSVEALDSAAEVLRRGELFGVFPEGTRSRTGALGNGHTGAARLATRTGVPIYPVGITGTDEIQAPGARLPAVGKSCRIEIGEPIETESFRRPGEQRQAWRELTDTVMDAIAGLSGQRRAGDSSVVRLPERAAVVTADKQLASVS